MSFKEDKYPLHTLMQAEQGRHMVLQEVLDWIDEQGWTICERGVHNYEPITLMKSEVVAKFFEIDQQEFDNEKRAMLAEMSA